MPGFLSHRASYKAKTACGISVGARDARRCATIGNAARSVNDEFLDFISALEKLYGARRARTTSQRWLRRPMTRERRGDALQGDLRCSIVVEQTVRFLKRVRELR